jgi:thymidine phosphorylase
MNKKIGDKVSKGETLMTIHCHKEQLKLAEEISASVTKHDIKISGSKPRAKKKLILEVVTKFAPKTKPKKKK